MRIESKTVHELVFTVEYFESTEGGMDGDAFGGEVSTIEEAVRLWDLAMIHSRSCGWVIVARPTVKTVRV